MWVIVLYLLFRSSDTETAAEAPLLTKPGLGKFLDVYSHEHLNLTPKVVSNLYKFYSH